MITIFAYLIALFMLGIGNAVATYHILRYRDRQDSSLTVLVGYYALVIVILIITALAIDWSTFFTFA